MKGLNKITMFMFSMLFSLIGVLLGVAFFTLLERKIMGVSHFRKGPNKVMIMGLSQPISDAVKLLTKETSKIKPHKLFMFWTAPMLGLFIMLLSWTNYESKFNTLSNSFKLFFILTILSISVFVFIMTSWGSNTKYSIIGGYRAISQVISYEVCLCVFILFMCYMSKSFSFKTLKMMQENLPFMVSITPIFFLWMTLCMAESNRTPFDLSEGESEIVSGFNIEYGGGLFASIFIMEYGMLLLLSFITSIMFLNSSFILIKTIIFSILYIIIRCCYPRMRYNKLMDLCWKILLPISLSTLTLALMI